MIPGFSLAKFLLACYQRSMSTNSISGRKVWFGLVSASFIAFHPAAIGAPKPGTAAKWERFERTFESSTTYTNPVQQAALAAVFISPAGETNKVYGFWDGGGTWRVRFSPNQLGKWTYTTTCSDSQNKGLHGQAGEFTCTASSSKSRFTQHGPVTASPDGRYLMHEDRTPFFWMGDTAWNGALLATAEEWNTYIRERARQKFSAVQWVTTQWRAAPGGDKAHQLAYTGGSRIAINPAFFQQLDAKVEALNKAGLLSVPVLLWAIAGGSNPDVNPGVSLPEDQAILLARYMVARWGADATVWILAGDGDYRGAKAERWRRIGRAVFGGVAHAPVMLHPGGMQWNWEDFKDEKWLGLVGYQSGHGDDVKSLKWLIDGPPTQDWMRLPHRPFLNLEPPYENHLAYDSKKPITPEAVRRAIYWSLLNTPTAGVSYGGHGVWGWDDGKNPPTDHPGAGTPLPWQKALSMPGAEQMAHVVDFFGSIDFWRLRPASVFVTEQPGGETPRRFIAAARTDQKDLMVVYVPEDRTVEIKLDSLPPSPNITWINPRTGERTSAVAVVTASTCQFPTPSEGDWILLMKTEKEPAK